MTNKQKKMVYAMIVDGFSIHEIAEATKTSEKEIEREFKFVLPAKPKVPKKPSVYPNLERWMEETMFTQRKLAEKLGCHYTWVSMVMHGKGNLRKDDIDIILEVTGMTYEECFAKEKAPEDAATSIKG